MWMAPRTLVTAPGATLPTVAARGGSATYHAPPIQATIAIEAILRTRMKLVVDVAHPLFEDVRVDLRGGQIRVTEHQLNGPQIGATLEQVRGKRMPEHVWTDPRLETRLSRVGPENFPEPDARQAWSAAARVHEEAWTVPPAKQGAARLPDIPPHPDDSLVTNRNDAL